MSRRVGWLVALTLVTLFGVAAESASALTTRPAVACSNAATPPTVGGKPLNLTGIYSWTQGTFYVRQAGTCVYLMGQSLRDANGPPGKGFTSIFVGGLSGRAPRIRLSGIWSDVPYGQIGGHGSIVWGVRDVANVPVLDVLRSSGGWGASEIRRVKKVAVHG